MGLFGGLFNSGGNESRSTSSNTTNQIDNRATFGDGAVQATGGSTVNVLDAGAIGKAFDVVDSVIGKQQAATKDMTTQAFRALDTTGALVSAAYNDAKGRGALTDYITLGALLLAGGVAIYALRKG